MEKLLSFSVCISILNEEENLKNCIENIISASKGFDCELLFLNNGSSDASGEILNQYVSLKNCDVISLDKTVELQIARNILLNRSKSNVAVFLDADGEVSSNYFSTLLENFSEDVSIYSGPVPEQSSEINIFFELHYLALMKSDPNFLIGANFVVKIDDALKVGGFPDITFQRGDETALIKLMKENGSKHQFLSELSSSNHFVSEPINFIRSFYYEGQNAFLYMLYFDESVFLKSLYKTIFIVGILLFSMGLVMGNKYLVMGGVLAFFVKFLIRAKYWSVLFSHFIKIVSISSIKGLLVTLLAHITHELGFWYSMLTKKRPKTWRKIK